MTKAYELVKPIGYFPLGIYRLRENRKCYYIECIDDPSHGYNMETEIVENMPEYFVEVKEKGSSLELAIEFIDLVKYICSPRAMQSCVEQETMKLLKKLMKK